MFLLVLLVNYILPSSSIAQWDDIRQELKSLPTKRVRFAPRTSSTTIQNFEDTIYILRANAGQTLTLKINSLGARASVTLYGVDGKPLSPVFSGFGNSEGKNFRVRLPKTGDYYILGGSGPSNHFHDFTVYIK